MIADSSDSSLGAYREHRHFAAENGHAGSSAKRSGRDGEPLLLHVPPGTLVREGETLFADLDRLGARMVAARGGRGGRGNARFATSTRQAPRIGEVGEPGEKRRIQLELKLIADVGLVGLPNAGKSTLLAAVTGAHPKIADYAFTTLHPNLGVAELSGGRTLVLADVPGLIEGAHQGAGLGLDFLRHLERTRVLIHVVDASQGIEAGQAALATIEQELRLFSTALADRPTLLAFNKMDLPGAAAIRDALAERHPEAFLLSAVRREGVAQLLEAAAATAKRHAGAPDVPQDIARHRTYRHEGRRRDPVHVSHDNAVFRVHAADVERMVAMTDLESDEAVARLQKRLRERGVDAALEAAGCKNGDDVAIGDFEFTYVDEQ